MTWFAAFVLGGAIAGLYCASLWFTVERALTVSRPVLWLALTSLARLALVGALFFGLVALEPEIAVAALFGFAVARAGFAYRLGGCAHGR